MRRLYLRKWMCMKGRSGVSLIELVVTMVIAFIIMVGVGGVLVHQQIAWNEMYSRVHEGLIADGYVSRGSFEGVVRKSSLSVRSPEIGVGGDLNVFYYADWVSIEPDRYARFYNSDGVLFVEYGVLDSDGSLLDAVRRERLADDVSSLGFSVIGPCVEMVMDLDDGMYDMTVVSSAIRHSE